MRLLLEQLGAAVCHRLAARSFPWGDAFMPLCARCTGIYCGVFLAFCFFLLKKRMDAGKPFSKAQTWLTALMILPIALDGLGSYLGFWESNQWRRVLSGGLVGAVMPGLLLLAMNVDPVREGNTKPIYEKTRELLLLLAGSAALGPGLYWGLPLAGLLALGSVAGEILLWGGVLRLLLGALFSGRDLPLWRISLTVAFSGLYAMGGLMR